jgi:hypothetical protein
MGEAQHERKSCFNPPYSARLLWKVLSQTKIIVTVLKAEEGVRRKVSVRTRTKEWVENNGYNAPQKHNQKTASPPRKKLFRKFKGGCYLCQ